MYTQSQIIDFISKNRSVLKEKFHVTKIGLFGSFARNEQTEYSDIDLIIDFEENTNNLFELKIALRKFFQEKLNLDVDICRGKYIKPRFKDRISKEAVYVD